MTMRSIINIVRRAGGGELRSWGLFSLVWGSRPKPVCDGPVPPPGLINSGMLNSQYMQMLAQHQADERVQQWYMNQMQQMQGSGRPHSLMSGLIGSGLTDLFGFGGRTHG